MRAILCVVLVGLVCGCASMQPFMRAQAGGQGVDLGLVAGAKQSEGTFLSDNWGKILSALVVGVAVDRVAENNGWLWYDGDKDVSGVPAAGGDYSSQGATVVVSESTGNTITINVGENQQNRSE